MPMVLAVTKPASSRMKQNNLDYKFFPRISFHHQQLQRFHQAKTVLTLKYTFLMNPPMRRVCSGIILVCLGAQVYFVALSDHSPVNASLSSKRHLRHDVSNLDELHTERRHWLFEEESKETTIVSSENEFPKPTSMISHLAEPEEAEVGPDTASLIDDNKSVTKLLQTEKVALLPEPLQILREYIAHHGVGVVAHDKIEDDTKYIVLGYDCAHRAGNIFSAAIGRVLLAVLTNRTLVLKQVDRSSCDQMLSVASWIPTVSFKTLKSRDVFTWRQRKQSDQGCVNVFNTTNQYQCMDLLRDAPVGTAARMAQDIHEHRIVDFFGLAGCVHSEIPGWKGRFDMRLPTCDEFVRASFAGELIDQERIDKLYKYGLDFLYGMLYRHTFQLSDLFLQSIETEGGTFDPDAYTIALHSRHPSQQKDGQIDDGSDISKERVCLDPIMDKRNNTAKCQLLIMTDREVCNHALTNYAREHGCEGITVAHTKVSAKSGRNEHGPFQGKGFWKDMALVSQARHGFVATGRSSSGLVQNLMVFDRIMEHLSLLANDELNIQERHGMEICYHQYEGPARPDWPTSS